MATTEDDVVVRLRLRDVAQFIAEVRAGRLSIDELEKKISSAGRTAAKESSSGGGFSMFRSLMSHLAFAVPYALAGMATATAGFAVKSAADLEQVQVAFTSMLGSASAAKDMVTKLQDLAQNTPFRLQGIEDATQKLLGFGFQAKNIIPTLTAVGDAASGLRLSEGDIEGVVLALGQIQTKGVLRGDEVMQLNERGINAKKYLGAALHMNPVQLDKAETKGKISADKALPIILAGMENDPQFHGMAAKEAKTLTGVFSNLLDALQRNLGALVGPYVPAMTAWLQKLIDKVPQYVDFLGRILTSVVSGAQTAVTLGQVLFAKVGDLAGEAKVWAQGLIDQVGSALGDGNWSGVGQVFGRSIAGAIKGTGSTGSVDWFDIGKTATKGVITFALGFVSELLDPVMWFNIVKDHWFDIAVIVVAVLTDGVGGAIGKAGVFLKGVPFLKWVGRILELTQVAISWLRPRLLKVLGKIGEWIWEGFAKEFPELATRVAQNFYHIREFFTKDLLAFGEAGGNWVLGWLGNIARFIAQAPWRLAKLLIQFGKWLGQQIVSIGAGFATMVGAAIMGVIGPVIDWLRKQWHMVQGWFGDAVDSTPVAPGTPTPSMGDPSGGAGDSGMVPGLAGGGIVTRGGWTDVGERGRERLYLPRGSSVIPLPRDGDYAGALAGREIHTHVSIDGKEILHAVHRAQDDKMARR